jgi:hypothetical protein
MVQALEEGQKRLLIVAAMGLRFALMLASIRNSDAPMPYRSGLCSPAISQRAPLVDRSRHVLSLGQENVSEAAL